MICRLLTETEFKASLEGKATNVTRKTDAVIDIWPYVQEIQKDVSLPEAAIQNNWVEYVYQGQFTHYDHVLIPFEEGNVFLVIVVDRIHRDIFGHYLLNLNIEYGVNNLGFESL